MAVVKAEPTKRLLFPLAVNLTEIKRQTNLRPLRSMRVLIGCEFSGVVRDAFAALGWDAWSCDLLPSERPGNHFQGDVFDHLDRGWDLLIYHWPCTRICNSGVRWLFGGRGIGRDLKRWRLMEADALAFNRLLSSPVQHVCGENPIPHRHARLIMGAYSQIIQPWQFGHGETKATCLWLKNLPPLVPTKVVNGRRPRVHYESPGPQRWKNRSRTLPGIAAAMADQWTKHLLSPSGHSLTVRRERLSGNGLADYWAGGESLRKE